MPDGNQHRTGKTVEVNNTDAEGRLTLADALWFAQEKAGAEVRSARRRRQPPLPFALCLGWPLAAGC